MDCLHWTPGTQSLTLLSENSNGSEIIISQLRGKGGRGENGQVVSNWPYVDHVQL